jgi:sortase A
VIRKAGFALVVLGVLVLAWVGVTLTWGDPVTSLYTRHEQRELAQRLDAIDRQWAADTRSLLAAGSRATSEDAVARTRAAVLRERASAYRRTLSPGDPVGRIVVPRLSLRMVVVEGTAASDLRRGPGHYDAASGRNTGLPGMSGVIGIAGHRTTWEHPFRDLDDLRPGDRIELQMPYGRFVYTVFHHRVVTATDWSIFRRRPFEKLVLTACHPLHRATHRWVVFARLSAGPTA